MSDDDTSEFEWDPSRSFQTAWSSVSQRQQQQPKRRRSRYGKGASSRGRESRRSLATRQDPANTINPTSLKCLQELEDDTTSNSTPLIERKSTLHRSVSLDTVPPTTKEPLPPLRTLHTRSASVSAIPASALQRPSLHTRSKSYASKALSDWSETDAENVNPNSGRSLFRSPQPNDRIIPLHRSSVSPLSPPIKTMKLQLEPLEEVDLRTRPRKTRRLSDFGHLASSFSEIAKGGETWPAQPPPPPITSILTSPSGSELLVETGSSSVGPNSAGSSSRKRGVASDELDDCSSGARSRSRIMFSPQLTRTSTFSDSSHPFIFDDEEVEDDTQQSLVGDSSGGRRCRAKSFDTATDESELGEVEISMTKSFDSIDNGGDASFLPPLHRASSAKFAASLFGTSVPSKQLSTDLIIETMPCFADVRHLIRALKKEKKRASALPTINWTVAPLKDWTPERRVAFLQWSTKQVGFTVRSGGGSLAYLQISKAKGAEVLNSLTEAHKYYTKLSKSNGKAGAGPIPMELSVQKPMQSSPIIDASLGDVKPRRLLGLGRNRREHDQSIDADLLHTMKAMSISPVEPAASTNKRRVSSTKLVRNVTVEPVLEGSTSSFDGLGDFLLKPPRLSGEHQIRGQDLVSHLHGLSPMAPTRRPRRSLGSDLGLRIETGEPSPMVPPPPSSARSHGTKRLSFGQECLETPQVKQMHWEGRSGGRDWGAHPGCPMDITDRLLRLLEERYEEESDLPPACSQTSCFLDTEFEAVAGSSPAEDGFETEDLIIEEEDDGDFASNDDDDDIEMLLPPRRSSVAAAAAFSSLRLDDRSTLLGPPSPQVFQRRRQAMAKHRRVSLAVQPFDTRALRAARMPSFARNMSRRSSVLHPRLSTFGDAATFATAEALPEVSTDVEETPENPLLQATMLGNVFSYLGEGDLLLRTSPVCTLWADVSTEAHATLVLSSVGCSAMGNEAGTDGSLETEIDDVEDEQNEAKTNHVMKSMEKSWSYLLESFPWACFLSDGAFKRVYKVYNKVTGLEEAVSVMDIDEIENTGNVHVVGAELAVSAMLASLVRRNVCPNFVVTRRVFTCPFEPPASHWGCSENKRPKSRAYNPNKRAGRKPRQPSKNKSGRYQYMRMELCQEGDAEEYLKRMPDEMTTTCVARTMLFQMAFSLYTAADRYSLKHYDVKLLNFFLQKVDDKSDKASTVLRYGLGSLNFALEMPTDTGVIVKLADYGTATVQSETNGQPVTIGQFTTLENSPPEFMILGDAATQGHGHDAFGLGLCMLHLFTGHRPYEEILEEVSCPPGLRKKLTKIYLEHSGYDVIRSLMLAEVEVDEDEAIVDGEPDEVLLDTLYRYLVLFGIPEDKYQQKEHGRVWRAITSCLEGGKGKGYGGKRRRKGPDQNTFEHHQKQYSLLMGNNEYIARARSRLQSMEGGMELLQALTNFDPSKRASMSDVLNSTFMATLREEGKTSYCEERCNVMSFLSYATAS